MTKELTRQGMDPERRAELEEKWLARVNRWPLDSPVAVTDAMGKVLRAWCNQVISHDSYKLLFAGLKEIRAGRVDELNLERQGADAGGDGRFSGMTVSYDSNQEPPKTNGAQTANGEAHDDEHDEHDGRAANGEG